MTRIELSPEIAVSERDAVHGWLRQFNVANNEQFMQKMERGAAKPLFILARNERGEILGGLFADTVFSWLRVQIMAVSPDHRRRGIGGQLLGSAETEARARGCTYSYVDTMSFQSPEFYRRAGYSEIGVIPNWDSHGHSKHFFIKAL